MRTEVKKKRLITKWFLIAMAVLLVFTAVETLLQVYRFNHVEITMEDGSVRVYRQVSYSGETENGKFGRWERTHVFEDRNGTERVTVSYRYDSADAEVLAGQSPAPQFIREQWLEKGFISRLPQEVLFSNAIITFVVGMVWITMKVFLGAMDRMDRGGARDKISGGAILGDPMMGAIGHNVSQKNKEAWGTEKKVDRRLE